MKTKQSAEEIERKKLLAIFKEAGRKIDPETAEIDRYYCCPHNPYGLYPESEMPKELIGVSKEYFVRSPGSEIWVYEGDLPRATREALWNRLERIQKERSREATASMLR